MTMNRNDEPAFPHLLDRCQRIDETEHWPGMSLRDWFAGMALCGLLANKYSKCQIDCEPPVAYAFADAMLTEREK